MQYKANVNYKIVYLTKTGEEKEIDFTPEKDMNIAELITTIKSNNEDFFKLKSANEIKGDENMEENKEVVTESEEMLTNLYDVLEARNFEDVDITDKEIDIMVAYSLDPELGDTDSYDAFLTTLAKELKVNPMTVEDARKADIITVDLYQWVNDHFDELDSLLDVSASDKEEEAIRITEMMEGIISGAASDEFYNELMKGKSLTEADNEDNEDDEDDEEFEEVETDETDEIKEPIEQEEEFEEIPADSDIIENDNTEELPGTGESTEETKEAVKDAIDEVKENITAEDAFAVETSNSSISVLIADEQSAIDGYNAFLNQTRDTLIPALYEVLEKEIQEIIADEEDHINKLNAIKDNFKLDNIPPINESKEIKEEDISNLKVGDMVTIPYARGPRYTQDRSEWVKGKILNINPDYADLEVPTTLTVSTSQLNKWLSKEESKLTEDHQLYYDDIQKMSTEERHKLWMAEHDKDFEDTDEGNDMFWDWAEEEFPVKELNEDKNEKVKVEDVITFLDADIDSPYAEASWDEIQEFIDENPNMTAREIAIGYKNYEETGEFNVPEFNIEDAAAKVQQEAEEHYKGSEINADTLDRVARRFFSLEYTEDQLDELQKYFEEQEKKWIASEGGYIEESKSE